MPNNRFNKQVTPKGYKAGGSVKAGPGPTPSRPRGGKPKPTPSKQQRKMGAGAMARKKEDSSKTLGKFMKAKIDSTESTVKKGGIGADRVLSKYRNPKRAEKFIKSGGLRKNAKDAAYYKSIGLTGKRGEQAAKDFFKPESKKMPVSNLLAISNRVKKKMGGSLKPVQPNQKGLSKLPTEVRNKMGYMQDGGKVKDKPGKNIVLGKTFHPITELAMINNIVKRFNSRDKKFASVNDLQDRHKEIKEKFFTKGVKPSEIQKLDKEFKSRLVKAKSRANEIISNRPGMKEYRKKQQKAKAIDTGSEN
jgi:hypothetical protein